MSLWTLLQRRLDLPSVPDNSISPAVQSSLPVPRHDSTNRRSAMPAGSPERRPKSPERFLHTPQSSISSLIRRAKEAERQARTPVRPPRMHRETIQEPQRVQGFKITLPTLQILFSGVHSTRWVSTQLQCSVGRGFQESPFGGQGCWRWQQEDLCSTIWNLQASCHFFQGNVQDQPCQD